MDNQDRGQLTGGGNPSDKQDRAQANRRQRGLLTVLSSDIRLGQHTRPKSCKPQAMPT